MSLSRSQPCAVKRIAGWLIAYVIAGKLIVHIIAGQLIVVAKSFLVCTEIEFSSYRFDHIVD
jgi:hypothetical protein